MIVDIPDDVGVIFSKIIFLTTQIDELPKNNTYNLPKKEIINAMKKKRDEYRIEFCIVLEKAVKHGLLPAAHLQLTKT